MRVGVGEIGGKLFGRPARSGIDVPAFGAQQVERGCGKVVGDNDFQCWNPRMSCQSPVIALSVCVGPPSIIATAVRGWL